MLQIRPTFSESWYRVANLRAKLRTSAQIWRQHYRGERWYVVRDPAGNQFHRLSDAAYAFVGLLDGTRTVGEAWDLVGGQLADDAPTQPEVIQILSQLYAANLLEADISPDATILLRRHKQLTKQKLQNRLMNVLFPRIPLWNPDRFLQRWMPFAKLLMGKIGALIWLIVVGAAIVVLVPRWTELKAAAAHAIDWKGNGGNYLLIWATFVCIKLMHELGHAFSCRRFGGEVHELGVMFLVFVPTPYVDASTAWAFPSRWARMFVGAAGMIVELFFASLMAFVWIYTDPNSLLNQLAFNAMLIASVTTVIFNANPLLRYDGYYMLSDFWEIPNLRQKSVEYTLGLIKRHVFRVKETQPLPPPLQRTWLFLYAVCSSIYRVFVGVMIVLIVTYEIPVVGILMAIGGVVTWLVVPVYKVVKYLMLEPELHRKRGRAALFVGAVAAAAVVLFGLIPFPNSIEGSGIVEPADRQVLHARQAGFVSQVLAHDGQTLQKGDIILICKDDRLDSQIAQYQAQIRALEAKRTQSSVNDQAQRKMDEEQMLDLREQLADVQRHQDELTVRAGIAGKLIAPMIDDLPGSFLARGAEIGTIATNQSLEIRTVLEQRDAQLAARESLRSEIRLAGDAATTLYGHDAELVQGATDSLPHPSDGLRGGGEIAVDPRDTHQLKTEDPQFEVRVQLSNPGQLFVPGQRAYVRFRLASQPLIEQWARRIWQLIQTRGSQSRWT